MDEQYNVFLNNHHSTKQEKMLLDYNTNVVDYIVKSLKTPSKKAIDVLELGVGKGYFAKACLSYGKKHDMRIKYSAFDLNKEMLSNLKKFDKSIETYHGELPSLTVSSGAKFDVVYCAFVVEHLKTGIEVYELISNVKKVLKKDGLIVFFTPNALSQKFEFYNIDYTHHYPTTARNVTMAFNDTGIEDVKCLKINGLCTYKGFYNPFIRVSHKLLFKLYSYRLLSVLFWPIYRVPLYGLNNFFFRVFCFFKEENLMFIAKR